MRIVTALDGKDKLALQVVTHCMVVVLWSSLLLIWHAISFQPSLENSKSNLRPRDVAVNHIAASDQILAHKAKIGVF